MRWKQFVGVGLLLIASGVFVSSVPAPTIIPATETSTSILGAMTPEVRVELAKAWGVYADDVATPEYAYCITDYRTQQLNPNTILLTITGVQRAQPEEATPSSVVFGCEGLPGLHSHPPTDCEKTVAGWACVPWEEETLELCSPSPQDLEGASHDWHRFGVVQCGANRFLLFVPPVVPDGTTVSLEHSPRIPMAKKEGFAGSYETRNAGKGDRPRPIDDKQRYDENFERIFGRHPREPVSKPEKSTS